MRLTALSKGRLPPCTTAITMGDGWRGVYTQALPILRKLQIPNGSWPKIGCSAVGCLRRSDRKRHAARHVDRKIDEVSRRPSIYFDALSERGWVGLALFLTILGYSWYNCSWLVRH